MKPIATVTKKSVSKNMENLWDVTMNMTLTDESVEVINKDYSMRCRTGDAIGSKMDQLKKLMQADIDDYKAGQAIFVNAELVSAVSTVQAGLVV